MTMTRLAAGLAAIAALAACTSIYQPEPTAGPFAIVEFNDGNFFGQAPHRSRTNLAAQAVHDRDSFDYGGRRSVVFAAASSNACGPAERIISFRTRTQDDQVRPLRFQAGQKITIVARTEGVSFNSNIAETTHNSSIDCRSSAEFTPVAGRTYTIAHNEYRDGRCSIDVRDKATNAPPPELSVRENLICHSA